jgi:hypothetical protein
MDFFLPVLFSELILWKSLALSGENENEGKNSEQNEKQNTFAEDLIDVLTVENDTSEKETIENPILSNIDDEFPTCNF